MRVLIPALTLAAMVTLAAGCGSQKKTTATSSAGAVAGTIRIVEKDFSLTPSTIAVAKPGTYRIDGVNQGGTSHAIAIDGQGVDERGSTAGPGGTSTITVTLTKPGHYRIFCPVGNHASLGMEGTLTVGGSASGGSGGGSTTSTNSGYGYG